MARVWRVALIALALCAAACNRAPDVRTLEFLALGTVVSITAVDPEAVLTHLEPDLRRHLDDWGAQMYAYGEGELARSNARFITGRCTAVSERLRTLIDDAQHFETRHAGLFSAGLAQLTRLWHLHATPPEHWAPPPASAVAALVNPPPRARNLQPRNGQICATGPVALDVGGFAKGRMIDEVMAMLAAAGITQAIVNLGGDLKARGAHIDRAWRVAIRDPGGGALAGIEVADGEAVFTSGNYERYFEHEGKRYGHILDPISGHPLANIASVTVVGRDAAATDAAATALYVAASRAWASDPTLRSLPPVADAAHFVIVDIEGGVFATQSMRARLQVLQPPARPIHVLPRAPIS